MQFDYLAFDLDGTLLNSQKEIPEGTIEYLKRVSQNLILISSRHIYEMEKYAKELELTNSDFIVSSDGQYIFNGEGTLLKTMNFLNISDMIRIKKMGYNELKIYTKKFDYYYKIRKLDGFNWLRFIYKDLKTKFFHTSSKKKSIYFLSSLLFSKIEKVVLFGECKEILFEKYNIMQFNDNKIEITHKSVNKYLALRFLQNKQKINLERLLYFGDDMNDFDVFKKLKNTVAMGNANKKIKDLSSFITITNDEDGVLNFLINNSII